VLLLLPAPKGSSFNDLFNFLYESIVDDIRRGLEIVQAMFRCFAVRGKEGSMEDIMNFPHFRKVKSECNM
jgi:hypothetical protein